VEYVRELLEGIGLEGRRIQMINISSAMGGQFAWSAAEMTEEIRRMGPNPLKAENGGLATDISPKEPVSTKA
jgi:coenzyme F420-reducing hydrogenase delta subunit